MSRDPYSAIIDAAERGKGVLLTVAECRFLAQRPEIKSNAGLLEIEWRKLPRYSRYEVSELGEVRRDYRKLKLTETDSRHLNVTLYSDEGKQWRVGVHNLVARAFIGPPPPNKPFACHKNGRAWENHKDNLYWGDHADNTADMMRHASLERSQDGRAIYEQNNSEGTSNA